MRRHAFEGLAPTASCIEVLPEQLKDAQAEIERLSFPNLDPCKVA